MAAIGSQSEDSKHHLIASFLLYVKLYAKQFCNLPLGTAVDGKSDGNSFRYVMKGN